MSSLDVIDYRKRIAYAVIFAVAMGYFEAAVVVYLRQIFYPGGFSFPLKIIPTNLLKVELAREFATMIMLAAAAALAGKRFWERFGYFIIMFGIWDIFYYVWLNVAIAWPASFFDWDILFLIPLPWIGPVIAPVLISIMMIISGVIIVRLFARGRSFCPTVLAWVFALIGTAAILFSFMRDTDATLHQRMPSPYLYSFLLIGLICYAIAFWHSYRNSKSL
jgi:hypothetical protein